MPGTWEPVEGVKTGDLLDPRDTVKARLLEAQSPACNNPLPTTTPPCGIAGPTVEVV
jgi:hypothetical protein